MPSQPTASQQLFGKRKNMFGPSRRTVSAESGVKRVRKNPKPNLSVSNVRRLVAKEILNKAEKKVFIQTNINVGVQTANGSSPTSVYLTPNTSQGTGDQQRIGNRIRVTNGQITGFVNLLPYNAVTNSSAPPIWVKMWLCSYIRQNTSTVGSTDATTSFFQASGGTNGFNGSMQDLVAPVNQDSWKLYETRTIKLGVANTNATQPASTGAWLDSSSMSVQFQFAIPAEHCTQLSYNDTASTIATNKNLWLFVQAVPADGSGGGGQAPVEFHITNFQEFTDM